MEKPYCKLSNETNIIGCIAAVARTLRENGMEEEVKELHDRIFSDEKITFEEIFEIFKDYVIVVY